MKWGWKLIDASNWRFDDNLAVAKDWATGRWYVVKDGGYMLVDYDTAAQAIAAAEKVSDDQKRAIGDGRA